MFIAAGIVFLAAAVACFVLIDVLCDHRADGRQGSLAETFFGPPMGSASLAEMLSAATYTQEGRRFLPWLRIAVVVAIAAFICLVALLQRSI